MGCVFIRSLGWISCDSSKNIALWSNPHSCLVTVHLIISLCCLFFRLSTAGNRELFSTYLLYQCSFRHLHGDKVDLMGCNHPPPHCRWERTGQGSLQNMVRACKAAPACTQREKHTKQTQLCQAHFFNSPQHNPLCLLQWTTFSLCLTLRINSPDRSW